jgi:hypothetical protein
MCYVRRENVEAREKELKAPMSQAEVDAAIASSGELYEAGRKSGIAWAQAEIAELKSQVTTLHLENLEYGQRIAMDAVKIEKLRAGAEPGENVSETKNSAP